MAKKRTVKNAALKVNEAYSIIRDRLSSFLGYSHNGNRDLYKVFGYEREVSVQALLEMYKRNDIANRIIRAFPQATWREAPVICDDTGDSSEKGTEGYSPFVAAVEDFMDKKNVLRFIERADRLASIGRFGLLFMGFGDGQDPRVPLTSGKAPLLFMSPYMGEVGATVNKWDEDIKSPRYGLPLQYSLQSAQMNGGEKTSPHRAIVAHHSRVLHISEFLDQDDTYGMPRLLPIYNRLKDLEKVVGGSAETFWLTANRGMALWADKEASLTETDIQAIKDQADEFSHQLRRNLVGTGMTAEVLGSESPDPQPNAEILIQLIAGAVGIPQRILLGSERGELASGQDENNWQSRMDERRQTFATPMVLRPFIQKMIDTGNIPMPSAADNVEEGTEEEVVVKPNGRRARRHRVVINSGEEGAEHVFYIEWPMPAIGEAERATIALSRTQAIVAYSNAPSAGLVVPTQEWRKDIMDLPPESDYEPEAVEQPLDEMDPALTGDDPEGEKPPFEKGKKKPPFAKVIANAEPMSLYVSRKVTNAKSIKDWARKAGFKDIVPDLHVTIIHSASKVDWMQMPEAFNPQDGNLMVHPGGPRLIECFEKIGRKEGRYCYVLSFVCSELSWRHQNLVYAGCTHGFDNYQPHITIAYSDKKLDMKEVEAYQGAITLGPEKFEEVK